MEISESTQKNIEERLPYPPSFIDRFMRFIQHLPVPYWLTYLVLFILQTIFNNIVTWVTGYLPAYRLDPQSPLWPLLLWAPLAIMTYLDSTALEALSNFGPLLDISPETMQRLTYEFTTMPVRGAFIYSSIFAGLYVLNTYMLLGPVYSHYSQFTMICGILEGLPSFLIGGVFVFHTIRQLRLVNRTVKMVKRFNLFQLDPVYAFSVLTSRTGMAYILLISLFFVIYPIDPSLAPSILALVILASVFPLAAFTLPLWVVHQRLIAEKRRLLAEHDQRVESTLAQLYRSVDDNKLGEVAQLNSVITTLNAGRSILEEIPTWPWRTGLFTSFLSAVVLPIILLLVQIAIQKWLNG